MALRWGGPALSKKFHVFGDDLRALCGKWAFKSDEPEITKAPEGKGPDDCADCYKKLEKHFKVSTEPTKIKRGGKAHAPGHE